jgi:hypothetical protein
MQSTEAGEPMTETLSLTHITTDALPDCFGDCGRVARVLVNGGQGFHNTPLCPRCAAKYVEEFAKEVEVRQ